LGLFTDPDHYDHVIL